MSEPGKPAKSESSRRGAPIGGVYNWTLFTAAALLFAVVCIVSARVGASALPTECGEVGRPNLDAAVFLALVGAVLSLLLAVYGLLRMSSARWLRLACACIAAAEVSAWVVALLYYRHQIDLYNGGTCF